MADLDGYGDVRPEWLKALALRTRPAPVRGEGDHPERSPRVRTLIRAVIGAEGLPGQEVVVRNVSPGGMCIASRTLLPSCGDTLRVALPGQGDLRAQVRWVGDGEFGIQLLGPIDGGGAGPGGGRRRHAGFSAALERLLGVRPYRERGSSGLRAV
jgi:hypothetical protein